MCTVVLALDVIAGAPLLVAANRDEFLMRPSAPFGELERGIYGGRDLGAGGTWFALRQDGGMALLTNVRPGKPRDDARRSRGEIVLELLRAKTAEAMRARMAELSPRSYNPFNVLFGVNGDWSYASSETAEIARVGRGVHLLGNTSLDDPEDPKTVVLEGRGIASLDAAEARAELTALLANDFFVDYGGYGTRWSMFYAGPHEPIDRVWIAETSVRRERFVEHQVGR